MPDRSVILELERTIFSRGENLTDWCRRHRLDYMRTWRLVHGRNSLANPYTEKLRAACKRDGIDPDRALRFERRHPDDDGERQFSVKRWQGHRVAARIRERLGLSYGEIANATGIPRSTVASQILGYATSRIYRAGRHFAEDRRGKIARFFKKRGATAQEIAELWWPIDPPPTAALEAVPPELRRYLEGGLRMLSEETLAAFGLKDDPFGGFAREGDELFLGRNQKRALRSMKGAIRKRELAGLVGPVGSGKTQLWRHLRRTLERDARHRFIFLRDPTQERLTAHEVMDALLETVVGRPVQGRWKRKRALEEGLKAQADQGRIVTLVVEEGQLVTDTILRTLKGLAEIADGFRSLVGVLVIAQMQIHDSLRSVRVEEVRRRLRIIDLPGIHHTEIGAYLEQRLKWRGCRKKVFDAGAVHVLRHKNYRAVTTTPLGLGNVASHAMEIAHRRNHKTVAADDAEAALREGDRA